MVKIHSVNQFCKEIELLSIEKECGYIEAITMYCKETGLDVESVSKLITPTMKAKIQSEAESLNLLTKKTARLEFLD